MKPLYCGVGGKTNKSRPDQEVSSFQWVVLGQRSASRPQICQAAFSTVYFECLNLTAVSEQTPLIFKQAEHKSFDVVSSSFKIVAFPMSAENSREISLLWNMKSQVLRTFENYIVTFVRMDTLAFSYIAIESLLESVVVNVNLLASTLWQYAYMHVCSE